MYGLWTPYINEPNMLNWYHLPAGQQRELEAYRPDGRELVPLADDHYRLVHGAAVRYANASVAALNLPQHNARHFRLTEEHGMAAIAKLEELSGEQFPLAVKQALGPALRLHDCHHSGSTFREDAPYPELLWRPQESGHGITTEWISALAANAFSQRYDAPLPWRIFQTMVIWSSTFGGHTARGQELGVPNVQPQGLWGCLMRAADVCPPADPAEWLQEGLSVLYSEVGATPAPATWQDFMASRHGFLIYIEHCFDELDRAAGVSLTEALGWRSNIVRLRGSIDALAAWPPPQQRTLVPC